MTTLTAIHQGFVLDVADPALLSESLTLAMDYRGDVTLTLRDGRVIEGYIFDRRKNPAPQIRLLPRDSEERVVVADADIARLEVTGKDTAAGKTFENWVKRYVEKKRLGEAASIESEEA